MKRAPLAVFAAVLGLSAAASAGSFESQAAAVAAAARRGARAVRASAASRARYAAQGAPTEFAKKIVCARPPAASGLPGNLVFYTRLDGSAAAARPDETAAGLDDYRRAYLDGDVFHYDAWSCDTQDYLFAFDAESLLKTTAGETSRKVAGHARVETRGELDWTGTLDCVAYW